MSDSPNNNCEEALRKDHRNLQEDQALHLEVMLLREKFLTQAQALLHGDLHTGSIFVTPESTKVIDPEFAYYGPIGFDIGAVLANLLLNAAGHEYWSTDEGARKQHRAYLLVLLKPSGPGSRPASARCGTSTASIGSHLPLDIGSLYGTNFAGCGRLCRLQNHSPHCQPLACRRH